MSDQHSLFSSHSKYTLSSLPDEILIHILSFLPTKQAIITSILSKRWIHLWRHVPVLDFLDTEVNSLDNIYRFNQFIDTNFLSLPEPSHTIHTFSLDVQYHPSIPFSGLDHQTSLTNIHNWIKHVVQRNVQYLSLKLVITLHPNILSSRTLVFLKLEEIHVDEVSYSSYRFPSLKTLYLEDVYFNEYLDFMFFLDGCPVLEDLHISYVDVGELIDQIDFEHFESSSSLRSCKRAYIEGFIHRFPIKMLSNLEFLHIQLWKDTIHVSDFSTFHNLTHLVLKCGWDIVVQVLQHCPNLQNLELYQNLHDEPTEDDKEDWADPDFIPDCLSSNLTTCTIQDFAFVSLQRDIMLARFILKNARVLKTMTIGCSGDKSEVERQLSACPRASATCQLSFHYQFIDDIEF